MSPDIVCISVTRKYEMVKRREKVEETRRRIAKATYELHSTIGPASTTVAQIAERARLPRQTIYRNFPTQLDLFRGCIAFGLDLSPPPDPVAWQEIADRDQRLHSGLTELYAWFEDVEAIMTNSLRDIGALPAAAEAMQPLAELMQFMHDTLSTGWEIHSVSPLIRLAIDFSTWKMLRRVEGIESEAIIEFWVQLIGCRSNRG